MDEQPESATPSTAPSTPGGQLPPKWSQTLTGDPAGQVPIGVGDEIPAALVEQLPDGSAVVVSSVGGRPIPQPWSAELISRSPFRGPLLRSVGGQVQSPGPNCRYRVLFVNDWDGTRPGGA